VTLTSDVGWAYAAQMKGRLLSLAPAVRLVVDLTHDLPRHRIPEAAFVLRAMASSFPPGTVHVAVIDPGVGGRRAPIVVQCREGSYLVGPDNGVLAPLATTLGVARVVRLDPDRRSGPARVGTTFDGRDLFAPAAAWLARGRSVGQLGGPATLTDLRLPEPRRRPGGGAEGEVVHVDHFGNLITNIPSAWIRTLRGRVSVAVGERALRVVRWVRSYESLGPGRLGALGSSFGTAEIAVARGSAAARLGGATGRSVRFVGVGGGARTTETVNNAARLRRRRR
jgi:S-adenosyl-L-methionine hydrolase (adenosine-forming)